VKLFCDFLQKVSCVVSAVYRVFHGFAQKRALRGDITGLEVLNIKAKRNQTSIQLNTLKVDAENAYQRLKVLMNYEGDFSVPSNIEPLAEINEIPNTLPVFDVLHSESEYYKSLVRIEKNNVLPDFSISYFIGSNRQPNNKYYHGFQVGVALPLFYGSSRAKIKASKISANAKQLSTDNEINLLNNELNQLLSEKLKYKALLDDFKTSGEPLMNAIMETALKSYELGEINYYQFVSSYESAIQIKLEQLENVLKYNQTTSEIKYFSK
jgi:cobalt-zinc-cadmium resistance protein CzcA